MASRKISVSDIYVERKDEDNKRFRQDFGDIQKMSDSLKKHGLLHPIVVDKITDESSTYKYKLVAGERRLTAALMSGWIEIDATIRDELTDFERKELELEENVQRKDISWQEQIEAYRQLDALKREKYGSKSKGSQSEGWTLQDTANAVNKAVGTISEDIKLANDLFNNPELRKKIGLMPKKVAMKIVEREKRAIKMQTLIDNRKLTISSDLENGDCVELIKKIPTGSIACLITDPPWAVEGVLEVAKGNLSGKYEGEANLYGKDDMQIIYQNLIPELYRVMIPGAHFYIFFGIQWYDWLKKTLEKNDFTVHPSPLVWCKGRPTMIPNPYHYVPSYELILTGCKNPQNRTLAHPRSNSLTEFPAVAPTKRVHSLQKPVELMQLFIENSTVVGECVLDPFAGSAVTLKAAKKSGRLSKGFELNKENFYAAQEWLAKED